MVRYPHSAKIIVETGTVVSGAWVPGTPSESQITGRYEIVSTNNIIRINAAGNEVIVKGEFFTKDQPIAGATKLEIESLGVSKPIICWSEHQSHSVISV